MKNKIQFILFIALVLVSTTILQAQTLEDALGFTETVNDVPEASIHLFIPVAMAIAALFGIKKLKG